jgi:hypothetical protein
MVSHNKISIPRAARGVIAHNINGLHATRAGEPEGDNFDTEPVRDCDAEKFGSHDGVIPVFV